MARKVHSSGLRERQRMRNNDSSGKWYVGYRDADGAWHHITSTSDEQYARETAARLNDEPDDEECRLLGITGNETFEVRER